MKPAPIHAEALGLLIDNGQPLQALGEAGYFFLRQQEADLARKCFLALSLSAPNDPAGPLGLAEAEFFEQQVRRGLEHLDEALRRRFADRHSMARAYQLRGDMLAHGKKFKQAVAAYQRAAELYEGQPLRQIVQERVRLLELMLRATGDR